MHFVIPSVYCLNGNGEDSYREENLDDLAGDEGAIGHGSPYL